MQGKRNIQHEPGRGRKRGRPSVVESKDDPDLPLKASEMRSLGLSWREIAQRLHIGRSTARRLAMAYQKGNPSQIETTSDSTVPKCCDTRAHEGIGQDAVFPIDSDILERLPKTFQIFSSLLRKAGDMKRKTD